MRKKLCFSLSFQFISIAFATRILAGILLTLIYTYYYPDRKLADTFRYFDDSYHLHQLLFENPKQYFLILSGLDAEFEVMTPNASDMNNWFPALRTSLYNDNRTVIRINAILRWFSFGSYYFHLTLFAFAGFVGQLYLFKAFEKYFITKKTAFAIILLFIPSVIFWSSGILKEGPLFLVFGYLIYTLEIISREGLSVKKTILIAFLFLILFHLKFYVALMLIPILTLFWAIKKWKNVSIYVIVLFNYFSFFAIALIWHFIRWKWSLFTVFKWKKLDFEGLGKVMNAKSAINSSLPLEDNPLSFLLNMPIGLFNSIFRPYIWESYSPLILLSALENLVLFVFICFCIYFRKREKPSVINICFITYAISLLTIIGMVTPIMGSLVRYKIPALPFLLLAFLMIVDTNKLNSKFPFLRPKI